MEVKKLSRRERERLRQRKEMLDAAIRLFPKKGYHKVTMHEIAAEAEFAIGTLYKFFKNKEELYKSILVDQSERFHEIITKSIEQGRDETEKLRNYVKAKGSIFKDNAPFIRLYFAETRGASFNIMAGLDKELRERHDKLVNLIASIFESGIKKKVFRKTAEPYHLAVTLDSICNAFLFLWLESSDLQDFPDDPDIVLNILFKGLIEP